ncbi:ENDD1 protein, partial [Rhadina sibilatrix]|nr:ENDD1 protein [Rhadina sibilatrix]
MLGLLLLQVLASCLWLGHSEVMKSFASCSQFFYRNTIPDNALEPQNPARICQRYKNQYHFATLYDRDLHIPVHSAYIYRPGSGDRYNSWFVESQVMMGKRHPREAALEGTTVLLGSDPHFALSCFVIPDRAYLLPVKSQTGFWATFTLTNIVPQNSSLNKGAWNDYERNTTAQNTKGCITTYIITGAVPGNDYISNNRVNVPSHIWSAACCQTNSTMKTWAVIAENNKNQVQNLTLAQLEAKLSQLYGRGNVSLFHSACPR